MYNLAHWIMMHVQCFYASYRFTMGGQNDFQNLKFCTHLQAMYIYTYNIVLVGSMIILYILYYYSNLQSSKQCIYNFFYRSWKCCNYAIIIFCSNYLFGINKLYVIFHGVCIKDISCQPSFSLVSPTSSTTIE